MRPSKEEDLTNLYPSWNKQVTWDEFVGAKIDEVNAFAKKWFPNDQKNEKKVCYIWATAIENVLSEGRNNICMILS